MGGFLMHYVKQLTKDDCGFASLKNLLANLFKDSSYLNLKQDENHGPYSYKEITEIAINEGVILKGLRFDKIEELSQFVKNKPTIVSIKEECTLHAVLIVKIKKKSVTYLDSNKGVISKRKEDFFDQWDRTALVVSDYKKNDTKIFNDKFVSKRSISLAIIFQLLSSIAMMVGILFLDKNIWFGLSVITFGLAVALDLIFRSRSFKILKAIDSRCESKELITNNDFDLYVDRLEDYKKSFVTIITSSVSSVIMSVFIIFILLLNNYHNVFLIAVVLIIELFDLSFLNKHEEKRRSELEQLESQMKKSSHNEEKHMLLLKLHSLSYKYGYYKYFQKVFESFILIISIILIMLMDGIINFQYIVFYFFVLEMLKKGIRYMLKLSKTIANHRFIKVKLINILTDKASK